MVIGDKLCFDQFETNLSTLNKILWIQTEQGETAIKKSIIPSSIY